MGFDRHVGEAVGWLSLFPDFGICFGFWILIYGYFMFILDVIWSAGGWSRWLSLLRKCTWCIAPPLRDLGLDFGFWYMEGFSYIGCDILEMRSDRQVDEADDCHYLENAPPVRPQQLLSIFQTGEKLQITKRSANRRFALAVKKQTSNNSVSTRVPKMLA